MENEYPETLFIVNESRLTDAIIREMATHGCAQFCVWKCHKPAFPTITMDDGTIVHKMTTAQREQHTRAVHKFNMFESLDSMGSIRWQSNDYENGKVVRGAIIRVITAKPDTLPEEWEKYWQLLYLLDGLYYFAEPNAKVYECNLVETIAKTLLGTLPEFP